MNGLVVDPSPVQRRILANVLKRAGCEEVESAEDLAQALAALADDARTRFDLVIVERDLPDGNGLDVVRRYRELPAEGPATALLVTVRNARRDVMDAIEAGADAYVLKPLDPPTLLERVEATIAAKQSAEADAEVASQPEAADKPAEAEAAPVEASAPVEAETPAEAEAPSEPEPEAKAA